MQFLLYLNQLCTDAVVAEATTNLYNQWYQLEHECIRLFFQLLAPPHSLEIHQHLLHQTDCICVCVRVCIGTYMCMCMYVCVFVCVVM